MADNSQIQLYKEEEREMNYSTPCSSRSVSPHPGASCSGLSQEPIFTSNRNAEMETENLSTAASRFGMRSATELVGDKEPRPAPEPSPVATLAAASGARGSCDNTKENSNRRNVFGGVVEQVLTLLLLVDLFATGQKPWRTKHNASVNLKIEAQAAEAFATFILYCDMVEVETGKKFQYGGRLVFQTGSSYISAVN